MGWYNKKARYSWQRVLQVKEIFLTDFHALLLICFVTVKSEKAFVTLFDVKQKCIGFTDCFFLQKNFHHFHLYFFVLTKRMLVSFYAKFVKCMTNAQLNRYSTCSKVFYEPTMFIIASQLINRHLLGICYMTQIQNGIVQHTQDK